MEVTHSDLLLYSPTTRPVMFLFSIFSKLFFFIKSCFVSSWFFISFLYFLFCHKNDDKGTHILYDFVLNQIEYIRLLFAFAQHQHYWWIGSKTKIMLHFRRTCQIYSSKRQTQNKKHAHISVFILMSCPKMHVSFFAAHSVYQFPAIIHLNIEICCGFIFH